MDDAIFTTESGQRRLVDEWLPSWLKTRRWFGGKDRAITACRIARRTRLGETWLHAIEVHFDHGTPETYFVPLTSVASAEAAAVVAPVDGGFLVDATHVPELRTALFRVMAGWDSVQDLHADRTAAFATLFPPPNVPASRVLSVEQSNTSLIYGDRLFVKLFRKLEPGINPDVEMTRFLSDTAGFPHMPRFRAALHWTDTSLALASEFLPNPGDAWSLALKEFARYVDNPTALDDWLAAARRIGQRTGEMHYAFAHAPNEFRELTPEPLTAEDVGAILMSMLETARAAAEALSQDSIAASSEAIGMLPRLLSALDGMRPIQALIERIQQQPPRGVKIRIHGDYHLGQVIHTGDDFLIMDFGGEPLRSVAERRAKQPAVRDVAGMLRSFHYAAFAARGNAAPETSEAWAQASQEAFLAGWRSALADSPVANESLLPVFLLQKAFYELSYELSHRPDWAHIPMRGILTLTHGPR